ncbi:MAG: hypothetical protein CSA70_11775 [Rhodobacterales bacterium]|nr:MAG: hypothetical protein CSA70_11775 [Rhodobacterales bacterium]
MEQTAWAAAWFLPFVLPLCVWVAWTDMKGMRIPNKTVLLLGAVFLVIGPIALPFDTYLWRLTHIVVILLAGIVLNAAGAVGAGDAKFAAAAAPFVARADLGILLALYAANLLAAFVTHRIAKHTALRRMAPDWQSWSVGWDFPMGLSLGGTLALYLILGAVLGGA